MNKIDFLKCVFTVANGKTQPITEAQWLDLYGSITKYHEAKNDKKTVEALAVVMQNLSKMILSATDVMIKKGLKDCEKLANADSFAIIPDNAFLAFSKNPNETSYACLIGDVRSIFQNTITKMFHKNVPMDFHFECLAKCIEATAKKETLMPIIKTYYDYPIAGKLIYVIAKVKFWKDAQVNGIEDSNGDLIPCRSQNKDFWEPIIEIATGRILNWEIGKSAIVKYEVNQNLSYHIEAINGMILKTQEDDTAPSWLRNGFINTDDRILLNIDSQGLIKNWHPIKA